MVSQTNTRTARNIMIDNEKDSYIEQLRVVKTGYGTINRNRSDIYNEILALGLKMREVKDDIGDKDFDKLISFMDKFDLKKLKLI